MALHYQNPNYSINQHQFYNPFEHQNFHFQDTNDIFIPQIETEFLCFDNPLSPTTLFHFDEPSFDDVQLQPSDHFHHDHHDFIIPNTTPFEYIDFPPPMLLPTEDILPYSEDYHTQFITPFTKKQKIESYLPCYTPEIFNPPELNHDFRFDNGVLMMEEQFNCINNHHFEFNDGGLAEFNEGYGENINDDNKVKVKVISAQSKAARERRRKITMKTHELGKLIPGGTKMNTAEMFQATSNYVKFMQAQLGILESIKTLHKDDCNKEANLNNLQILSSKLVQENLFAKEKCLVPLDVLSVLEEHCDMETKPSISQFIKEILH